MVDGYRRRDKRVDVNERLRLFVVNVSGQVIKFKSWYCDDAVSQAIGIRSKQCGVGVAACVKFAQSTTSDHDVFNCKTLRRFCLHLFRECKGDVGSFSDC